MILVAAILIGAVAAFALYQYVQSVEENAKPNPVEVYVVTADIDRGTLFADAQASIEKKTIPVEFRPGNYVTNLAELNGKVAVTQLAANQVLVQNMFVSADVATTSFRDRLTDPALVAIAVQIDGVRGMAGYLQGGDEVNILVTPGSRIAEEPPPGAPVNAVETPYEQTARYLYQKVKVLAVGDSVEPLPGEPVREADGATGGNTGSVILLVPPDAAQRIAAADPAQLYFTLVSSEWQPVPLAPIPTDELGGGSLPGEAGSLTPYGPDGYVSVAGN